MIIACGSPRNSIFTYMGVLDSCTLLSISFKVPVPQLGKLRPQVNIIVNFSKLILSSNYILEDVQILVHNIIVYDLIYNTIPTSSVTSIAIAFITL